MNNDWRYTPEKLEALGAEIGMTSPLGSSREPEPLKACPHCGYAKIERGNQGEMCWWMKCRHCGATGPTAEDEDFARAEWNQRAASSLREPSDDAIEAAFKAWREYWVPDTAYVTAKHRMVRETVRAAYAIDFPATSTGIPDSSLSRTLKDDQ